MSALWHRYSWHAAFTAAQRRGRVHISERSVILRKEGRRQSSVLACTSHMQDGVAHSNTNRAVAAPIPQPP